MIDITQTGSPEETSVALGFFDGLHLGHIEVIKAAMETYPKKTVIVTFNQQTLLPKFNVSQNIITFSQKEELLAEIGVDYIFAPDFALIRNLSSEQFVEEILIKKLHAKIVCCGYDFRFGKGGEGSADTLKELCSQRGIKAKVVPAFKVNGQIVSATFIRKCIREGDIKLANELLGYDLSFALEVVEGKKIGRTIGFPTINQKIPTSNVIPKFGVYKSWVIVNKKTYAGITNIGIKPTVNNGNEPIIETHIIGFSGDLYGKFIKVILREYIREEQKFKNIEELKIQIEKDFSETINKKEN